MTDKEQIQSLRIQIAGLRTVLATLLALEPSEARLHDAIRRLSQAQDGTLLYGGVAPVGGKLVEESVDSIFEVARLIRQAIEQTPLSPKDST
jgi:hypothetical protein